jgi:hypothetical protein
MCFGCFINLEHDSSTLRRSQERCHAQQGQNRLLQW